MRLKAYNITFGAQVFKALADTARLRIIHLILKNEEMCISDLEQILDYTQAKTSRHVTYLKNAGLISSRKDDQWVYYSLKDDMAEVVHHLISILEKDQILIDDLKLYKTLYANNVLAIRKLHNKLNRYQLPEWGKEI